MFLVRVRRLGALDAEALLRHPEAEARAAVRLPHLADPVVAAVLACVQAPASVRNLRDMMGRVLGLAPKRREGRLNVPWECMGVRGFCRVSVECVLEEQVCLV